MQACEVSILLIPKDGLKGERGCCIFLMSPLFRSFDLGDVDFLSFKKVAHCRYFFPLAYRDGLITRGKKNKKGIRVFFIIRQYQFATGKTHTLIPNKENKLKVYSGLLCRCAPHNDEPIEIVRVYI